MIRTAINPRLHPKEFLQYLFDVAVKRALPLENTAAYLPKPPSLASGGRTIVIGAGKAGGSMAQAVEALWPQDAPMQGLVVTRYHHTPPLPDSLKAMTLEGFKQRIEIIEAAHPVPDAAGLQASERMLAMLQGLTKNDLVLCLISGGGSALLTLPADGLTLADKQRINKALLRSGANISEMNCVRKHLSRIKGGRLAAACAPALVVTLTISDVPGDDPSIIASGPTVPDATTCADALSILKRYNIEVPVAVLDQLESGALETPKPGDAVFNGHDVHMIATPQQSLEAAAATARAAGLKAYILSDEMEGESREVGKVHAALARAAARGTGAFEKPCLILSGGETTVTIRNQAEGMPRGRGDDVKSRPGWGDDVKAHPGRDDDVKAHPGRDDDVKTHPGRGGRAGEFCMGLALALQGQSGVYALAADTDGIDGVEDNAGAFVAPDTLQRATAKGMKLDDYLDRNDAYSYFEAIDDLVVTGPTYTNVNDFRSLLIL